MKSFKCSKCGFFFSIEADFENMDKEEYEEVSACPCGEQMQEVDYSEDMIPTIESRKDSKEIKDLDNLRLQIYFDDLIRETKREELMTLGRKALEEIQAYRAIGTVEEFKALKEKNNEHYSDTEELDGYGYSCTNKTCNERIRAKAIDELTEAIQDGCKYIFDDSSGYVIRISEIEEIAEQLKKAGAT